MPKLPYFALFPMFEKSLSGRFKSYDRQNLGIDEEMYLVYAYFFLTLSVERLGQAGVTNTPPREKDRFPAYLKNHKSAIFKAVDPQISRYTVV